MNIRRSAEDYLEAMLMMRERHGYIRSIDVATQLGVTKPSVSFAVKQLRENGYIHMDKEGLITLTDRGAAIAERMYDRHKRVAGFLMTLGVREEVARADACRIEHDISEESFAAICRHAEEMQREERKE